MVSYIHPNAMMQVGLAVGANIAAVAAMFSRFEDIKIVALTVLMGTGYGILNNMIACRDCIEFFTFDLKYHGRDLNWRPVTTLNPNINALWWGILATWQVSAIAGLFLAVFTRRNFSKERKTRARQLAPYMAMGVMLIGLIAHIRARAAHAAMQANPIMKYPTVPLAFQAGWEACEIRNQTGYVGGFSLIAFVAGCELRRLQDN